MPPPLSFPPAQFRSQPLSLPPSSTVVRISAPHQCPLPTTERSRICCRGFHVLPSCNRDRCIVITIIVSLMNSKIDQFKCIYWKRSLKEEGLVVRIVLNRRLDDDGLSISDRVDRRPWPGWTEENYIASRNRPSSLLLLFSPLYYP